MQHTLKVLTVVILAAFTTACELERITFGDAAGTIRERWDPWIETDRTIYVARYTSTTIEMDIGMRFENRSRRTVAVPRCSQPHAPVLDKLVAGEWVEVLIPVDRCWEAPILVGPGRRLELNYRVRAGRPHTFIEPQFRTTHIPGTYRLRWDIYEHDPFSPFGIGAPLPVEHRVSNELRITY
jgi:hypothetical protein